MHATRSGHPHARWELYAHSRLLAWRGDRHLPPAGYAGALNQHACHAMSSFAGKAGGRKFRVAERRYWLALERTPPHQPTHSKREPFSSLAGTRPRTLFSLHAPQRGKELP